MIMSSPDYSMNTRVFLPNKLFEYMMAGLPVLSSPLIAVEEVLYHHDVGRVLASLEPEAIASAIEIMLADRSRLTDMSQNALRASSREFCWRREKLQLLRLYYQVLLQNFVSRENLTVFQRLDAVRGMKREQHAHSLYL